MNEIVVVFSFIMFLFHIEIIFGKSKNVAIGGIFGLNELLKDLVSVKYSISVKLFQKVRKIAS